MKTHSEHNENKNEIYEMSVRQDTRLDTPHDGPASEQENKSDVNVQELPPVDGGIKAWRFCLSAFVMELMVWGFGFSYGIFQNYYTTHPPFGGQSHIAIAAVGTTSLAVTYSESLILSLFLGRYPDLLKPCMWVGLGVCFTSLLISSFVNKVWQLIILQGVLAGMGAGAAYFPILLLLPQWFVHRRGLAVGMIFAGTGVGGFAVPFLLHALLDHLGFRWTLRIWAIMMLFLAGLALLGVQPRTPVPKFTNGRRRPRFVPPQMQFLRTALFWANSATITLQALSFFPVSLYLATYTTMVSSPLSATVALSLFNCAGVVGQVLVGHLCDRYPYVWIMFVSALGSGLATFLLWGFAGSLRLVFVFAIIFGALAGGFPSVGPIVSADCAGNKPEQAGIVFAAQLFLKGIAVIVGPMVSGVLYSGKSASSLVSGAVSYGYHGFGAIEIFVGVCAMGASFSSILVAWMRRRVKAQ
ncbi:MFS general substrate transporter [Sparassis latifolia]